MQTTFLNAAGVVLFTRDDMEQGNWTQEEYTVNATFPFVADKVIERGQRISFRDPATGSLEMFEVRNVTNIEPEHYQQIISEHIAVSELSDEHINTQEITDQTPAQALATVLIGTLWAVGNVAVNRTSSADISRGSVWQAVGTIAQNWNVYIVPRVTVNAAGAITGRYLDVTESTGVWRGLRLSVDKNMSDSSVVYDDSETLTALYGYGGNVDKAQASGDDTPEEVTFADEVWTATTDHPAKPAGQTYLEDPQATALYGRNGRPRFGFYQNGDIKDGATLLEKTWEALKQTNKPKISITGTVADLYRLGYKDQPIRLHDLAIVDIPETGESFYLQIIRCDVDLIDPTATRPEIGSYIANIIYINRETSKASGGGGGGGRGQSKEQYDDATTYSAFEKTNNMIGMVVGTKNGKNYIKAGEIALSINSQTGETKILLQADIIDIDGVVEALEAYDISCGNITTGNVNCQAVICEGSISGDMLYASGDVSIGLGGVSCDDVECDTLSVNGTAASWQSYTARFCSLSSNRWFMYTSSSGGTTPSGTQSGRVCNGFTDTTIHYLGKAST